MGIITDFFRSLRGERPPELSGMVAEPTEPDSEQPKIVPVPLDPNPAAGEHAAETPDPSPAEEPVTQNHGPLDGVVLNVSYATAVGHVRLHNEDNYFLHTGLMRDHPDTDGQLVLEDCFSAVFAVCDGMGGEAYGEEASHIAVETLRSYAPRLNRTPVAGLGELVDQYAAEANERICKMVEQRRCGRSGCTLVLVCTRGTEAYIFSIGDSRVYCNQGGTLRQITEDQTLAMRKVKAHIYTEEEARNSPDAHRITAFLGVDDRGVGLQTLKYPPVPLTNGTQLLLCSDGLTDMCRDEEIEAILLGAHENPAKALTEAALANGGIDNTTCVVLQVL